MNVESTPKKELYTGAHLRVWRRYYWHHGIYIGNGRVIHNNGVETDTLSIGVIESSLEEFVRSGRFYIVEHPRSPIDSAEVVGRAKARLGENSYSLLDNNCEHFANWCCTGLSDSNQVRNAGVGLLASFAVVTLMVVTNRDEWLCETVDG